MCPTRQPLIRWGLVKGIGYLHKFCIAHRDITENLVVDRDFCLKSVNFDVAMKVDDEDEMARLRRSQCSMYSPIKAGWWSSGAWHWLAETRHTRDYVLLVIT
jgi:serine/threonine protein kinase